MPDDSGVRGAVLQFVGGISGVLFIYVFEAVYRATLGFNSGIATEAIGAVSAIAAGRALIAGVADMQVRRATIQYQSQNPPPSTPPPTN